MSNSTKSQQELDKEKKSTIPTVEKLNIEVKAFTPTEIEVFKELTLIDGLYRGLYEDVEKNRIKIVQLKNVLKDVRAKPSLSRQIANGLFQDVTPTQRAEIIKNITNTLNSTYDAYVGQIEQLKHRSDEFGDVRIRLFKLIGYTLKIQHGLKHEDICSLLTEETTFEHYRPNDDINSDIAKALEVANSG